MVEILKQGITFLHCPRFTNERQNFLLMIERIITIIFRKTDAIITSIPLYGDQSFSAELNTSILTSSIYYILSTRRFGSALFTETCFETYIFIISLFQLNRFLLFLLFYPLLIFLLVLSFVKVFKISSCLVIVIFTFSVPVFLYILFM